VGCVWLRSLKAGPPPRPLTNLTCPVSSVTLIPRTIASQRTRQVRIDPTAAPKGPPIAEPTAPMTANTPTTADPEGPDPMYQPPMPHATPPPSPKPASPSTSMPGLPPAATPDVSTPGAIMRAERLARARAEKRGK